MRVFAASSLGLLLFVTVACGGGSDDATDGGGDQGGAAGQAGGNAGSTTAGGSGVAGTSGGGKAGAGQAGSGAGQAGSAAGQAGSGAGQAGAGASGGGQAGAGASGGGQAGAAGAQAGAGGAGQSGGGGGGQAGGSGDDLASNRDRLLGTYFDRLKSVPGKTQSNGLSGDTVTSVCDLWSKLDDSSRAVFATLTSRLQGSKLQDGSSALVHVKKVHRLAGGEGAKGSMPGACGGSGNRLFLSIDPVLHAALLAARDHKGAKQPGGYDLADSPPKGTFWRDSHDLAGPHAPFDASDETDQGAPRGQVHYFAVPTSSLASTPLGGIDVEDVVDPYALEIDQDYDCVHASNPLCSYITYGPLCLPMSSALGTELSASYGDLVLGWKPKGC